MNGFYKIVLMLLTFLVILYVFKKVKVMANYYTEKDFAAAIGALKSEFPAEILRTVERIYRLETRNFDSLQYKKTGTPGMEAHGAAFPYGWLLFERGWKENPASAPTGMLKMAESGTNISKPFLIFSAVIYPVRNLAQYVNTYGAGRWYSTKPDMQAVYIKRLNNIQTKYA